MLTAGTYIYHCSFMSLSGAVRFWSTYTCTDRPTVDVELSAATAAERRSRKQATCSAPVTVCETEERRRRNKEVRCQLFVVRRRRSRRRLRPAGTSTRTRRLPLSACPGLPGRPAIQALFLSLTKQSTNGLERSEQAGAWRSAASKSGASPPPCSKWPHHVSAASKLRTCFLGSVAAMGLFFAGLLMSSLHQLRRLSRIFQQPASQPASSSYLASQYTSSLELASCLRHRRGAACRTG